MLTRRQFVVRGAGAGLFLPSVLDFTSRAAAAVAAASPLDPTVIPKYVTPLVVPPAMPKTGTVQGKDGKSVDYYEIAVRQFQQHILPPVMGNAPTTVWGYGSVNHSGTFNYPAFTIEAKVGTPVRVKWLNQLVNASGAYLPHLLPVDPTLHWANPPGPRDSHPVFTATPGPYTGPVPIVTHLHGGHTAQESDGYPEAWYLPNASNIPAGYSKVGSWYDVNSGRAQSSLSVQWEPGTATFQYANDQRAATLWYHDHALGITRLNVYAGLAGFYLLRGGSGDLTGSTLPGPAPAVGDPAGKVYREIPIAIQDRSFAADGSLAYPDSRAAFDGYTGPYVPSSDVPPIWNPELFGDTIVVNGRTWPVLAVEKRRYRFRFLNGCNSRTLVLKIASDPLAARPAPAALPFWQIGSDGGFLPAKAQLAQVLLGPGERADVVVDFTGIAAGTDLYLINEGPDMPFAGFPATPADPASTGQVMKLHVVPATAADSSTPPAQLTLPAFSGVGAATVTRQVTLNERNTGGLPVAALLGTGTAAAPAAKMWNDPVTENPALNAVETWEIANTTVDAHPVHLHEVQFQVVNRQAPNAPARAPQSWETGFKDTVIALPGEITRIKARFDLAGRYVWHCHILEHEDNEMMRPLQIGPPAPSPSNLLTNPGFDTTVTPWVAYGATVTRDTAASHTAPASAKVVTTAGKVGGINLAAGKEVAVLGSTQYTFSAWVYSSTPLQYRMAWDEDDAAKNWLGPRQANVLHPGGGWALLSLTATTRSGTRYVNPYVDTDPQSGSRPSTTFWVDDLTLATSNVAPPANLLTNPGFDTAALPWTGYGATVVRDTSLSHTSPASLKVVTARGKVGGFNLVVGQEVAVAGGTQYTFSAWIYSASSAQYRIAWDEDDAAKNWLGPRQANVVHPGGGWALLAVTATTRSATRFVNPYFDTDPQSGTRPSVTFYADDLSLSRS